MQGRVHIISPRHVKATTFAHNRAGGSREPIANGGSEIQRADVAYERLSINRSAGVSAIDNCCRETLQKKKK